MFLYFVTDSDEISLNNYSLKFESCSYEVQVRLYETGTSQIVTCSNFFIIDLNIILLICSLEPKQIDTTSPTLCLFRTVCAKKELLVSWKK
jgi:hypothetical protein